MASIKKVPITEVPSLEDESSPLGLLFMTFLDKLFASGYEKTLELPDLGGISHQDRSDLLHERFSVHYAQESRKPLAQRSLWSVLWKTVGYSRVLLGVALFGVSAALQFGPVLILTRLVQHFQGVKDYDEASLWVLVALLFVFPVVSTIALAHSNAIMAHLGAQIRNALIGVIYRKSLRVSPYHRQTISTGRIITMFSDDTNQIRTFLYFLNNLVIAPAQIAVCLYLIYQQVGVSTFVGLGYALFTMPASGFVFAAVFAIRKVKLRYTDARVKLMNEILNGIRIIKYYAWERAFVDKIAFIRNDEVKYLAQGGYLFSSVFSLLLLGAPQIQTVLIFLTYIGTNHELDAAKAFTTLTLFGMMTSPFIFLPFGLQQYNMSLVAMRRILEFLEADDVENYIQLISPPAVTDTEGEKEVALELKNACLSWTPHEEEQKILAEAKEKKAQEQQAAAENDVESAQQAKEGEEEEDFSNTAIHTLRNLSLTVRRGELVAIVGAVGSGKSSFLSALLGEMHKRSGEVLLSKVTNEQGNTRAPTIAYCDQRPWIINATVKENILFGKEYDEQRFWAAIHAACMDDDLKLLSAGIHTEIGERGINLSGGQKARVCLARAVYNDADLYLLDDPLSAVDAHVGEFLFSQCIRGPMLAQKTRFLVTHHLHVLPHCDRIVILEKGLIKAQGSFEELQRSDIDLEQYLGENEEEHADDQHTMPAKEGEHEQTTALPPFPEKMKEEEVRVRAMTQEHIVEEVSHEPKSVEVAHTHADAQALPEGAPAKAKTEREGEGALITKEEKNEGDVSMDTYWTFVRTGGAIVFFLVIFMQLASQVLSIEANFWLSDWGKETSIDQFVKGRPMTKSRSFFWFRGYAGMQMASIVFMFCSRMLLTLHRTNTSITLHEQLVKRVLFLPVSFFDVTPIGRIINRFSQDMAIIDEDLSQSLSQVIGMGGSVLGSLGALAGSTKGAFLILAVPLGFMYNHFQSYFRKSNTAIARLESVSRSPIYADFSQTLSGTSTIRAYTQESRFISDLEDLANRNTVPGVLQQIAGQWLAIRLDFLGALIMLFMGALAVSLQDNNFIPAGYLALGLSYSIQLTSMLKMAVRVTATLEAQFNSVERVAHYTQLSGAEGLETVVPYGETKKLQSPVPAPKKEVVAPSAVTVFVGEGETSPSPSPKDARLEDVEKEAGAGDEAKRVFAPPPNWPAQGAVRFEGVSMRYRDGPLVLKDVSFDVQPRDKIGIAGRTGCGKSSLMVALFQIERLAGGRILIDGIDISTVPVHTLRSKLCIIPQDPVMFSASVRFNLDPFDERTDEEVWEVLRSVSMFEHVQALPGKLQEMVAEGGDNFSAGQRQLICIARAILRKPKILVLDEATASIDAETDALVQSMIRTKFTDCTVLTIAHRLHTIIDSSKVLVMDKGYVGEYDTPEALLSKPDGLFKGLWERHISEGGAAAPTQR